MKQKPESWQSSSVHLRVSALCRSTLFLLATSGIAGFLISAICYPVWHVAVETGQVLAGLIPYPPDNPFYIYHLKAWSLTCQFSALLLRTGCSEQTVSVVLSGLMGMVIFQALFFAAFAICRRVTVSFAAPFFIFCTSFIGYGISYPIVWFSCIDSFGTFGLFTSVLIAGLLGSARFRSGGFLLGLLFSLHGPYAIWTAGILGLTALLDAPLRNNLLRRSAIPFSIGLALSALSFGWQWLQFRHLAPVDPESTRQILVAFIRNLDYHRRPFEYISAGQLVALFGAVLGLALLRGADSRDNRRTLPLFCIVSLVAVNLAAGITHLDPQQVPSFILMLMPGRFININNILLAPMLLGALGRSREHTAGNIALAGFTAVSLTLAALENLHILPRLLGGITPVQWRLVLFGITTATACTITLLRQRTSPHAATVSKATCFLALVLTGLFFLWPLSGALFRADVHFRTVFTMANDPVLRQTAQRDGVLIVSSDIRLTQLLTRRPLLLEADSIDGLAYAPESAVILERILREVYGVNLFQKPPPGVTILGGVPKTYKELWETRTVSDWQKIRKDYGVTDILTVPVLRLQLPVIARDEKLVLYAIPPPEEKKGRARGKDFLPPAPLEGPPRGSEGE